jgi:hypothetical protein
MPTLIVNILLPLVMLGTPANTDTSSVSLDARYYEDGSAAVYQIANGVTQFPPLAAACIHPSMGCTPDASDSRFTIDNAQWVTFDNAPIAVCAPELDYDKGAQFPEDLTPCSYR